MRWKDAFFPHYTHRVIVARMSDMYSVHVLSGIKAAFLVLGTRVHTDSLERIPRTHVPRLQTRAAFPFPITTTIRLRPSHSAPLKLELRQHLIETDLPRQSKSVCILLIRGTEESGDTMESAEPELLGAITNEMVSPTSHRGRSAMPIQVSVIRGIEESGDTVHTFPSLGASAAAAC
ncbi:hypothetical protein AC578_7764 [Pseudocercospora eumusae]|uniref:Uncharacterized protein n=1 Tax=Pseudocercospora eumusae TaxID=321146 RepID=A0A139H0Z6_9PEZI|nr:hypothetical protein AC578_7764 [Pseudocercospora eumusae]